MKPTLGFIGLGNMGGPMARNLLQAGYAVVGFDVDENRLDAVSAAGAHVADSAAHVVRRCEVVLTSLPYSRTFVEVAEAALVPNAREGQVFIDLGTVAPAETRRLAEEFGEKGASLLDVPVSGGPGGAQSGTLRMFAGGDEEALERCRPILAVLGDPERIVYCGPSGTGQVVKGINQLGMGLARAVMLECLALGRLCGADLQAVRRAVGGEGGWRRILRDVADSVLAGQGNEVGVKSMQLAHYLAEADERGFQMPITRALHEFLKDAEKVVVEANRPSPSFWHELMRAGGVER